MRYVCKAARLIAADRRFERGNLDVDGADDLVIPGAIVLRSFKAITQPLHAIELRTQIGSLKVRLRVQHIRLLP